MSTLKKGDGQVPDIVRAVNAHDRLTAALEHVVAWMGATSPPVPVALTDEIHSALAAARKETP